MTAPGAPASRSYTGIGSRETPPEILALMTRLATALAQQGWTLRSGGAQGADTAFEHGARQGGGTAQVYLPWPSFGERPTPDPFAIVASALPAYEHARTLASGVHPTWSKLSPGAQRLHARNAFQVLGADLASPAVFVVCWANNPVWEGGQLANVAGGTGLAVRLAHARKIPIFHLGHEAHRQRIERWLAAPSALPPEGAARDAPTR